MRVDGRHAIVTLALVTAAITAFPTPVSGGSASVTNISKMDYHPIGKYKPGEPIPPTSAAGELKPNPSGKWVAYDTNVFETITYPNRHPGDKSDQDPPGNGDQPHGFCPQGDPQWTPWGKCDGREDTGNHQLEYLDHYESAMKEILGDFGVVIKRYPFQSPGSGEPGTALSAGAGRAINISATVPGATHPEESVLVSGHYDFTYSGPAAAWDSAEGHTEVIRIAKIMADYWRATGTRPAATVKFIPWDSEESGTFGSKDYVENNIPPGEEDQVRGYFNMDPCAGAYPAYKHGVPPERVPEVLQLTDPSTYDDRATKERVAAFNKRAETIVDEVFDHLDDTIETPAGPEPIFVSDKEAKAGLNGGDSQRDEVVTALGGLAAFTSDYANFAAVGIPIFNLFPDYFGPHADRTPGDTEGLSIVHTPNDNLTTINKLTSPDQTGLTASEGWAKGMEMCAHIEGWYMLQPEMGGAEPISGDVVAYYEALPNEAVKKDVVVFDASGSYQYSNPGSRGFADSLTYRWDFGDGSKATGRTASHRYGKIGRYPTSLTVTGPGGQTDTMRLPVTVVGSSLEAPVLRRVPRKASADGTFRLRWASTAPKSKSFRYFSVQQSRNAKNLVRDRAEREIERLWVPGESPGAPVQPWQRSDSPTPKTLGNKRHSGAASYWTGASPSTAPAGTDKETTLTLAKPVRIPKRGEVSLSYWSLFAMELDDRGVVEVAIDHADDSHEPEFNIVDQVTGAFCGDEPEVFTRDFESRTVDLTRFRGKKILLRFRWILGDSDGNRCQPAGWYVDDINLHAGVYRNIGRTKAKRFRVERRCRGIYWYRVAGVYRGGISTAPSNPRAARVERRCR